MGHKLAVITLMIVLAISFVIGAQQMSLYRDADESAQLIAVDGDVKLIVGGLRDAPEFSDTGRWWTGVWCGKVPFYRPLSSMLFWAEWKAFGEEFRWWTWVSIVLALLLAFSIWWGLVPIVGGGWAVVAVLALSLLHWRPWGGGHDIFRALLSWKNQPDALAGTFMMIGLGLAGRGRWAWGLLPMAVGVCCKEIAYSGFLLLPVIAYWRNRQTEEREAVLKVSLIAMNAALVLLIYRTLALDGSIGYQMGTNNEWVRRATLYYGGHPVRFALNGFWWALAIGAGILATFHACGKWSYWAVWALASIALFSIACVDALSWGISPLVAMIRFMEGWRHIVSSLLWLVCAVAALRKRPDLVVLGLVWMVAGAAPTFAAAQVQRHAQWFGEVGRSLMVVAAVQGITQLLAGSLSGPLWRPWKRGQ